MRGILVRLLLLAGFTILALVLFLPSTPLVKRLPSFWADNVPKIVLGLDLQGGMFLVLDVDQDKAVESHRQRLVSSVEEALKKKNIPFASVSVEGNGLAVAYLDDSTLEPIKKTIADEFPFSAPEVRDNRALFSLTEDEIKRVRDWAISQALETIRNRIDKFGVAEPLIQRQGDREIAIQLPGLKDPDRAIQLIGKTAVLEFRMVEDNVDPERIVRGEAPIPYGTEILYQQSTDKQTGVTSRIPFVMKKQSLLTGEYLADARVAFDTQYNEPYVSLTFDATGARVFERVTSENVNKRLAIVLDGKVHSAPVIREAITGGKAQISGGFTHDEAVDLAIVLRAGALPAPVTIVQNVTVGPTLGADSIEAGVRAAILGAILVLVFMAIYFKVSGLVADFAIFLNIIMLLGAMAYFSATLTLPGIAGIILTLGMGVDSNVLIFERIKEELRAGRTVRSAIQAGYDRAWWTVIDSHVTTLITAAVLFQFGSGPIKGFAVSLSLGILINLFTSLVGTKVAFDIQTEKMALKRLSI